MTSTTHQTPVYDPAQVEARWQERWAQAHTNEPDLDHPTRPFYNLMMFPYPSAQGLHVGNMFAFTGADIYGRFKRLQGHDVFEPIGFDAFGIHSENYALQAGVHPARLIPQNIATFPRPTIDNRPCIPRDVAASLVKKSGRFRCVTDQVRRSRAGQHYRVGRYCVN